MSAGQVVVPSGLPMGEGPVELPDGSWITTGVPDGWIWRIDPASGAVARWADVAGGANSAVVTTDGGLIVAQNGGMDLSMLLPGDLPPVRYVTPGLQRVHPDGSVTWFVEGLLSPNDLHVTPDGAIWMTDPPHFPPDGIQRGRILVVQPDASWEIWADDFRFNNGLAVEEDGAVLVFEEDSLLRLRSPQDREVVVEHLPTAGDGICLDEEGNIYAAGTTDGVVRVLSPRGEVLELLRSPIEGIVTDMAFVGPDRTTLVAFVSHPGALVAFEGRPVPGRQLVPFPVS